MINRSLGHRAPLLWLAAPLMAGLAIGKLGEPIPVGWLLGLAALSAMVAVVAAWRNWPTTWATGVMLAMMSAGDASYTLHRPRLADWDHLPPREVKFALQIERSFPKADPRKSAGLGMIVQAEVPIQELRGQRVYYSMRLRQGCAAPIQGAVVSVLGVLEPLARDPPPNSFDGYLANAGINFKLSRTRILAELAPAPVYRRFCARTLERFSNLLGAGVLTKQPSLVGVLRAMLLGQQHELSEEQTVLFRQTGTMHVFSISGLHIAVIAGALQALLTLLRLPRVLRLAIGLVALWLYVDITGTAPSAVRAFVMVACVQAALVLQVPRNPLAALAAATLAVVIVTPLDLFSASFQMSYGIVAALLLLGLPLNECWQEKMALFADLPKVSWAWHQRVRDYVWRGLLAATGIGVASSLVSAVTGAQFFSLFTPGSLLANLWVIPASSLVILMGLVSLLSGLAGIMAGTALANHAAVLVLWGIDRLLRANLRLPGMWFDANLRAVWVGPVGLAILLASLIAGYAGGWRGWCRAFWPPFAVVAIVLILGVQYS